MSRTRRSSPAPPALEIYARVIADAARILRPGGWLIVELGFTSLDGVKALRDGRWREITIQPDLAGIPRVLAARR
jgi:release factor glutamine methyltransferase